MAAQQQGDTYDKEVCQERRADMNKKIEVNTERLNNHGERLDILEQHKVGVDIKIDNLIQKIDDLISYLKWFLLGLLGSGGSFIIWQIKEVLSK